MQGQKHVMIPKKEHFNDDNKYPFSCSKKIKEKEKEKLTVWNIIAAITETCGPQHFPSRVHIIILSRHLLVWASNRSERWWNRLPILIRWWWPLWMFCWVHGDGGCVSLKSLPYWFNTEKEWWMDGCWKAFEIYGGEKKPIQREQNRFPLLPFGVRLSDSSFFLILLFTYRLLFLFPLFFFGLQLFILFRHVFKVICCL